LVTVTGVPLITSGKSKTFVVPVGTWQSAHVNLQPRVYGALMYPSER
jgi:hypothetical protein